AAKRRRRLQAFHDRELGVADQIAVSAHLEWCERCADELSDLRRIGSALQSLAPARPVRGYVDADVFTESVVSRLKAEDDASFVSRVREMFDDMHLVYAGL